MQKVSRSEDYSFTSTDNPLARVHVRKTMILVLTNSPKEYKIRTEDAVKDLHDRKVELFVIGAGDGIKNNLEHIVLDAQNILQTKDVSSIVSILKLLGKIVAGQLIGNLKAFRSWQ